MRRMDDETTVVATTNSVPLAESAWDALDDDAEDTTPGDDPSRSPEEENQSRIPGDPRNPNEQQPPFKELD